jgi:hypothetical protein
LQQCNADRQLADAEAQDDLIRPAQAQAEERVIRQRARTKSKAMLSIANQEKLVANSLEMEKQEEENGGSGGGQQPRSTCRKLMCADAPVCVCVLGYLQLS